VLLQFHFVIYCIIFLILFNFFYFFIPILSSTLFYLSLQVRTFCNLEIRCCFLLLSTLYISVTLYNYFFILSCTKCYFISPVKKKLATFYNCPHFFHRYIYVYVYVCIYTSFIYLIFIYLTLKK
jgi:hypothetical protein